MEVTKEELTKEILAFLGVRYVEDLYWKFTRPYSNVGDEEVAKELDTLIKDSFGITPSLEKQFSVKLETGTVQVYDFYVVNHDAYGELKIINYTDKAPSIGFILTLETFKHLKYNKQPKASEENPDLLEIRRILASSPEVHDVEIIDRENWGRVVSFSFDTGLEKIKLFCNRYSDKFEKELCVYYNNEDYSSARFYNFFPLAEKHSFNYIDEEFLDGWEYPYLSKDQATTVELLLETKGVVDISLDEIEELGIRDLRVLTYIDHAQSCVRKLGRIITNTIGD